MDRRIAFIGLGLMGYPMARRLLKAGYKLSVYNRTRSKAERLATHGAVVHGTPREAVADSSVLILMVTDADAVEQVLFESGGAVESLEPGTLVIDAGSTHPLREQGFARRLGKKGVGFVDAPVSGGVSGAENATLTIMAGGSTEDFRRAAPILQHLGRKTTHVGPPGSGQLCKTANQMIVGVTLGAVAEALVLARKGGADVSRIREALLGGFADSRILELHGKRMIDGSFEAGGKSELQRKDLAVALEMACQLAAPTPLTAAVQDLFHALIGGGGSLLDHSAIVKVYERLAGVRLHER